MILVSDQVSLSWPNAKASHLISFLTVEEIPPSGRIEIIPEAGRFFIESGFDYKDVDLGLSPSSDSGYFERDIAPVASAVEDGVSVVSSTSADKIDIVLNSSDGIPSGTYVRIKLGNIAAFGENGLRQIYNYSEIGSYRVDIRSYDNAGKMLKKAQAMVAILPPVRMSSGIEKRYLNGSPIGWLTFGTSETILSLVTNFNARCRYSTASNTPFAAMTDSFFYTDSAYTNYHTVTISGLVSGMFYNYFVRCQDENGVANDMANCDYVASTTPFRTIDDEPMTTVKCRELWLPFQISGQAGTEGNTTGSGSDGTNTSSSGTGGGSGPSSGGGGSGGGPGGGRGTDIGKPSGKKYLPYPPLPGAPGVVFTGWAYPNSEIAVLKDGVEAGAMQANAIAAFGGYLENMTKGVFTFTLWSVDSLKRRSANYSTTFYIDAGTQTTVANIIIPPTISLDATSLEPGATLTASGITVPSSKVEAWIFPKKVGKLNDNEIIKLEGLSSESGQWNVAIATDKLAGGEYYVKARTKIKDGIDMSGFSQSLPFSLGQVQPQTDSCAGADLNKDGKVNITDFSILLYYWGTNNACADQNSNGNVELTDFSIMMYYWTG